MFENFPLELYSTRYPPYLKLWRTFYTPIPFQNVRLKVVGVSLLIITWGECAIFLPVEFSPSCRHAGLRYFYFIQDDGKHVTKSRMESPKFIILSSLPEMRTLVQLGIESWKKPALKKRQIRPPCFDVSSLTSGWKVGKSRHHSDVLCNGRLSKPLPAPSSVSNGRVESVRSEPLSARRGARLVKNGGIVHLPRKLSAYNDFLLRYMWVHINT